MTIEELVKNTDKLDYQALCSALIKKFGVTRPVTWESVLPHPQQQGLFGGEVLRLIADHPTLATQKEIRPICLFPGDISQLLFFYVQLKDEKLPKSAIERITRKFIGGAAADRYIIWFFGNSAATNLKVVISGKEGKKIRLKTLSLEEGQWFKTYDLILNEVERKFNTGGLFQSLKEPSGLWKAVWEAFDISIVNKKFYAEIKEVFDLLVKEELPKSKGILLHDDERVQFAIRLIGRVIFCWFLKRKGIVAADVLSAKAVKNTSNYYHDLLERLFFDVFNTPRDERKGDLPDSIRDYPFLNGGLFEPQHEDHKGSWAVNIGNDWFIRFFGNTLERYNFTVDENSAASSEIAIDPEMLGRIFENLLAEQNPDTGESARKSTGSFYTPREIVDFMVEESLIAYLNANIGAYCNTPLQEDAIEDFVRTGILPDALKPYTKDLLRLLDTIKVLDPASGSGAFPISMLQKIVGLKHLLDTGSSFYDLKLRTIENSLYGVDIQPMATELSRLRCWLSLIVDEDPKDIKPLPNLDFKFITANSLIDLGSDEFIHKVETGKIPGMFLTGFIKKIDELRDIRKRYFEATVSQGGKDRLKKEFNAIQGDLLKMSLELIKQKFIDAEFSNKITGWNPFDDSKPAPFFNKSWMFGVEDGFDIVIGNPPYIQSRDEMFSEQDKELLYKSYETAEYQLNTYGLFIEKGFKLSRKNGHMAYIIPNYWLSTKYDKALRDFVFKKNSIVELVNVYKVFEHATVDTLLLMGQHINGTYPKSFIVKSVSKDSISIQDRLKALDTGNWGYCKRIIVDSPTEDVLVSFSDSLSLKGEYKLADFFVFKKGMQPYELGKGIPLQTKEMMKDKIYDAKIQHDSSWQPLIKARNVKHYRLDWHGDWIKYGQNLAAQRDPELFKGPRILIQRIVSSNKLSGVYTDKPFICNTDVITLKPKDISDKSDIFYFLGILLSRLCAAYLKSRNVNLDRAAFPKINVNTLESFPIPLATDAQKAPIIEGVKKILAAKQKDPQADTSALEKQIDEMVYKLYDLKPEEIAVVEGKG